MAAKLNEPGREEGRPAATGQTHSERRSDYELDASHYIQHGDPNESAQPANLWIALACVKLGWPVFPCRWEGKGPHWLSAQLVDDDGAKIPRSGGFYRASLDPEVIKDWFRKDPGMGIGIRCGQDERLIVLDVDVGEVPSSEEMRHSTEDHRLEFAGRICVNR